MILCNGKVIENWESLTPEKRERLIRKSKYSLQNLYERCNSLLIFNRVINTDIKRELLVPAVEKCLNIASHNTEGLKDFEIMKLFIKTYEKEKKNYPEMRKKPLDAESNFDGFKIVHRRDGQYRFYKNNLEN